MPAPLSTPRIATRPRLPHSSPQPLGLRNMAVPDRLVVSGTHENTYAWPRARVLFQHQINKHTNKRPADPSILASSTAHLDPRLPSS